MFPRAPRFEATRMSEIPGPNAYDPTEQEAHYKRGAMFERDARFRSISRTSDHGEGDVATGSGGSGSIATTSKVRLDARISTLEKDKSKLETRVKALEEQLNTVTAQSTTLQREKKQLQTDLRLCMQKIERSQAQQASNAKGQATRTENIVQLKEQVKTLEAKENAQRAHLERLNVRFARSEAEKWTATETAEGLRRKLKEAEKSSEKHQHEAESLSRDMQDIQSQNRIAEEALQDQRAYIDDLESGWERKENELQQEKEELLSANMLLSDRLSEKEEDIDDIRRQNDALVKVALRLAQRNNALRETIAEGTIDAEFARIEIRRLREELNWGRSSENHTQEDTQYEDEENITSEEGRSLTERWTQDMPSTEAEAEEENMLDELSLMQREEERIESMFDVLRLEQSKVDLEWKDCIIERLQGELKRVNAQHRALLLERQGQADMQDALLKAKKDLIAVEEAYEAGVLEVMQAHERLEQMQSDLNRSKTELSTMSGRLEKADGLQTKLHHARLREEALLHEKQELLEDLSRSSNYEAAYYRIRVETHKLMTRLSAREMQADELASLNAALASNNNPHQKINYLERIRRQLDETRLQYREMEEERNSLHRRCRELQAQVDVITHVDPQERLAADGPAVVMSDPMQLETSMDERQAARRAWQMRPKTRYTRIARPGTPAALDASVSAVSSSSHKPLRERPSRGALSERSRNATLAVSMNDAVVLTVDEDDSGEVSAFGLDGERSLDSHEEAPRRRILRARRSDTALGSRKSPVATLPSFDALAWELDKEHLSPPVPAFADTSSASTATSSSSSHSNRRAARLLEGELTLQDLTGG